MTGQVAQSGNHNILAREAPSTGVITGYYSDGRPIVTFTAKPTGTSPSGAEYDIENFGAKCDGSTDDTLAWDQALSMASGSGGGVVLHPGGVSIISATLAAQADDIIIRGVGFSSVIKPVAGATFDVISTPIPASAGLAGYVRNYLGIYDLMIDCSQMAGTVAGQGNGIHWYGVRYSRIRNVFVTGCPNWAILLDGDNTGPGNNFGYDNYVEDCIFDLCNAGCFQTNCEANQFKSNQFKWAGAATAAAQPALGTQNTYANHLQLNSGYAYVAGNVFGKGGTYTTPAIICSNSGPCRIIGNRFDQVRNQAVTLNAGNHEFIGNALGSPGSAISGVPAIQLGNSHNRVIGNSFDTTAGGANYTYAVAESGGPFTNNIIADNTLIAGTAGLISLNATSTAVVHHNPPYNPRGSITPPAVPASGTAQTNYSGGDVTVYVAGGTVTVIAVNGTATGMTSGAIRLPSGASITLTYSVAPSWSWFGD